MTAASQGDQAPVLFGNIGQDASMRSLNSAWERVLGYDREELGKLRLYELMPLRYRAAVTMAKRVLDTATLGPMEFSLRCKDGTHKRFLWHRRYYAEGRTMFIAGRQLIEQSEHPGHREEMLEYPSDSG